MTQTSKQYSPDQPSAKPASGETRVNEAKKTREKVFAIGKEGAEDFATLTDTVAKALNDAVAMSCDNIETCFKCSNLTSTLATDMSNEMFDYANKTLSDTIETSKELLACRTINDMFEVQNNSVKNTVASFFSQSSKLSEIMFEYVTDMLEPIKERMAKA